ncbi:MAG: hypothetical protein J6D03_06515 [Clostridia bacterium]|nr:hypothetical protein [Clostridia bacterium]
MKNKEVNDVLNTINDFIQNKEYKKASDYIKLTQKNLEEENSASEYIDELVKNLS